jgi:prevent-host-death family protein
MEVSIAEAKNTLSSLIRRVQEGEEVVISKHGRPVARIVRTKPAKRVLGAAQGQVREIDPDWWKPMSDKEAEEFYGER